MCVNKIYYLWLYIYKIIKCIITNNNVLNSLLIQYTLIIYTRKKRLRARDVFCILIDFFHFYFIILFINVYYSSVYSHTIELQLINSILYILYIYISCNIIVNNKVYLLFLYVSLFII